jgi:hypothetical protein
MLNSPARTLGDLRREGREQVYLRCEKCPRAGQYSLTGLILRLGIDQALPDLIAELSSDCPQRSAQGIEQCGAMLGEGMP